MANHKVWNFFELAEPTLKCPTKHHRPPDHGPPLTPPLSCSLMLELFSFFSLRKKQKKTEAEIKQSPLHIVRSMPIQATMKDGSFS